MPARRSIYPTGPDMLHVWKSPEDATAGCTAMSDADLQGVLRWLDRDRSPRFVLLPEAEYARLQAQWLLP